MKVGGVGGAALLTWGVAVGAVAQEGRWAASSDPVAQSLIAMERAWAEQDCTHKVVVDTILADDFEGTSPEGKRYTKAQAVSKAKASTEKARDCLLNRVDIHFFGDSIAVAYGSESWNTLADGKELKSCLVWTDTWLKRGGVWRIVAAHDMRCK
jgi:Domain of unknown function (DUF4440)